MHWQLTPHAIPLLVGLALLVVIAVVGWQRRSTPGAVYLMLLSLGAAIYSFGYIGELGSSRIQDALLWAKIEYIGTTTAPVMLFALVMVYTGNKRLLTPLSQVMLLVIPATTLFFTWTNEQHGMIWGNPTLAPLGRYFVVRFTPGGWYWVHIMYANILTVADVGLLLWALRRTSGLYRRQIGVLLCGALISVLALLLYLSGWVLPGVDLIPYSLILTAAVFSWGMFYSRLLDIVPVAREAVLNSMTDAMVVIDSQRRLVDLNPVAHQLAGTDIHQAIGHPVTEVFPEWSDITLELEGDRPGHVEVNMDIQGERRCFDVRLSPLFLDEHRQVGQLWVLRDITDRVKAEQKLQEHNQWLEILRRLDAELNRKLDLDYVANMALDVAMRMSLADAAFIALAEDEQVRVVHGLGSFPSEYVSKQMVLDKGITARVARTRQAELVTNVSVDPDYLPIIAETRAQITLPLVFGEKLVGVVALETKKPERFTEEVFEALKLLAVRIAVAVDNARMYEDRQLLVEDLDAFAHTVAHDLKNPLSTIALSTEVLLIAGRTVPPKERQEFLESIDRGARKMRQIIDNLLLLASVRGTAAVEMQPLEMGSTVTGAMEHLTVAIQESNAEVIVPDFWPAALGHGPWVEEVWANYISNAIKYGGKPPHVELGYDGQQNGMVRFWVRDNGRGIPEEDRPRLFKQFSRLSETEAKGHGLGLSIVERIAKRLGGEVGVESQVDQGSLFYFTLPGVPAGQE
jgi:PAS domain S-box-containing protein